MWIIEKCDYKKGGALQYGMPFKLKHFVSGNFIQIIMETKSEGKLNNKIFKIEIEENDDKNSEENKIFVFESISKKSSDEKFVRKNSFSFLKHKKTNYWFGLKKFNEENFDIQFFTEKLDENVFKIFLCNESEIIENNFLSSNFRVFKKFLNYIKTLNENTEFTSFELNLFEEKAKILSKCLMDLMDFCTNKLFFNNPEIKFGDINIHRQYVI